MDALQDEVESLEAILMDDVRITRNQSGIPELIEITIFPLVGDDTDQQFICVTLQVLPTPSYPDESPEFRLLKPRGLDDGRLDEIRSACWEKLRDTLGYPVVFDLIEVIREHLTGSPVPSGQCVVCLYGFTEGDEFTKTECFHYLHSYCLARHLMALRRNYQEEYEKLPAWQQKTANAFQAACPVCREIINDDSDSLKCAMPPAELQNAPEFQLTDELKELQRKMTSLFLHQKSRGAIIDLDAECGTAVISIETEEEIRRRQQRKQTDEQNLTVAISAADGWQESSLLSASGSGSSGNGSSSHTNENNALRSTASSSTNFAPVVQPTQRLSNDPTNNNYQHHNRRHFRGGRRHQQHHHHNRDRTERERERHENHNSSHSTAATTPTAAATSNAAGTGGKHAKGQAACAGHAR